MLLRDLRIENYRSFEHYKLDGLARVNLLVGDNNSGKTSVLEAAHFLISQGRLECAMETLHRREAVRRIVLAGGREIKEIPDVSSLFRRTQTNGTPAHVDVFTVAENSQPARCVQFRIVQFEDQSPHELQSEAFVAGEAHRSETRRFTQSGAVRDELRPMVRNTANGAFANLIAKIPKHIFVSSSGLSTPHLAKLWTTLLRNRHEGYVVQLLKIIHPDIGQIQFAPDTRSRSNLWIDRGDERIPASELGEGTLFLLSIGIALASSRGGATYIDEIDTGIHYSRLPDMWRMVIKAAAEMDLQLFVTTHSLDCIRALEQAVKADPTVADDVAVFRIDRTKDEAVRFAGEELPVVVEHEIEVR